MNRKFENDWLKPLNGLTEDTSPFLASVCSTCWRCIFPVDCITDFDCTFVSEVFTVYLGHRLCNTFRSSRRYGLVYFVRASIWLWYFSGYGYWFRVTDSYERCTRSRCIWDTCFENVSPVMFRLHCFWLSWWQCSVWTQRIRWIACICNNQLVNNNRRGPVQVEDPIFPWNIIFDRFEFNWTCAFDCGCFVITNSTQTVRMTPVTIIISRTCEIITTWFGFLPDFNLTS